MRLAIKWQIVTGLAIALLAVANSGGQSFGSLSKDKVTLMRKLPALVHLTGSSIAVRVTGSNQDATRDLQSLLEAELLKDNPELRVEEHSPSVVILCHITDFAHPQPTVTMRPSLATTKNAPKEQAYERVTGSLSVAFEAKTAGGQTLTSDNVTAKYDKEFDSSGNTASEGVKGSMTSAWKRVTGGASSEDLNPPTDAELREHLMLQAVRMIAEHVVNTSEAVEVYLAKHRGALDQGDKEAVAGLWEKALETFETATPDPKPAEDAYRLYNTGVAYEALAYKAEDPKAAMKYLEEAAINYGKAIDDRPEEKYFLEPQRRIEDAIAHYRQLDEQKHAPPPQPSEAQSAAAPPVPVTPKTPVAVKALSNAQVVAMVKSGMDDDTVAQTIKAAKAVDFDLTTSGQQELGKEGVSATVVAAMKTRTARSHLASTHSSASSAHGGSTHPN